MCVYVGRQPRIPGLIFDSPLYYCKALILDILLYTILCTIQYIIHLHVILRCFRALDWMRLTRSGVPPMITTLLGEITMINLTLLTSKGNIWDASTILHSSWKRHLNKNVIGVFKNKRVHGSTANFYYILLRLFIEKNSLW